MSNGRPLYLLAVRHGESEGNWAHELERRGSIEALETLQNNRHETNYRLTDFGRWQLQQTGTWLRDEFARGFERLFCSDTVRGRESAANLGLPDADWTPVSLLRERDCREFQSLTEAQKQELLDKLSGALLDSPYYFHAFGETPADLIDHRVSPMLERISGRDFGSVLWVCHGDYMRGIKSRIFHLTKDEFATLYQDDSKEGRILNGSVHIYTRIDPNCPSHVMTRFGWFRSVCPWQPDHPSNTGWQEIHHTSFTNEALLESATRFEQLVNHEVPDTFEDLAADKPGG